MSTPYGPENHPTLDSLLAFAKHGAEDVGKQFTKPDDDWMPIAILEGQQSMVVGLDRGFFEDGRTRNMLLLDLALTLTRLGTERIAFVNSGWTLVGEDAKQDEIRPRDHPNRREIVFAFALDADRTVGAVAEIERDGTNPPTLDAWKDTTMNLTFLDPLREILFVNVTAHRCLRAAGVNPDDEADMERAEKDGRLARALRAADAELVPRAKRVLRERRGN